MDCSNVPYIPAILCTMRNFTFMKNKKKKKKKGRHLIIKNNNHNLSVPRYNPHENSFSINAHILHARMHAHTHTHAFHYPRELICAQRPKRESLSSAAFFFLLLLSLSARAWKMRIDSRDTHTRKNSRVQRKELPPPRVCHSFRGWLSGP